MASSAARAGLFSRSRPRLDALLTRLHRLSLEQEQEVGRAGHYYPRGQDDSTSFKDKLVALEQDKASAVFLMLRATGATRIFEAGTSYGVSTLYLLAALRDNLAWGVGSRAAPSASPCVYGTEVEPEKAAKAYEHVRQGFAERGEAEDIEKNGQLQILEGDLLQTIPEQNFGKDPLDALLLDIWAPLALPTLQRLETALRPGALLFVDNTTSGKERYKDLLLYIRDPKNGWQSETLPYKGGFDMAVKTGS